jgi:hypothetical protein
MERKKMTIKINQMLRKWKLKMVEEEMYEEMAEETDNANN